jgi:hypothetical protein
VNGDKENVEQKGTLPDTTEQKGTC